MRLKLFSFFTIFILLGTAFIVFWNKQPVDPETQSRATPEAGSGFRRVEEVTGKSYMVATANIHASKAAQLMIEKGGTAVDAMIAAQLMLTLVEPQSSGLGGGGFLLLFNARSKRLSSFDGRETAPKAVTERLFLRDDGSALGFGEAVRSGRSIGVPGLVAMLEKVHAKHGRLPWPQLFQPAIQKANDGFLISHRLHSLLKRKGHKFFNKVAQELFFERDGSAKAEGVLLKNPALATSLELIAKEGAQGFYSGKLAQDIIETARLAPQVPSVMTLNDLSGYKAIERPPVCGFYRQHKVCGMGSPSSGGLTTTMILGLLDKFDLGTSPSAQAMHLIAEAEKLSYADRNRYLADEDFVPRPKGWLDESYLIERRRLITPDKAMKKAEAGSPPLMTRSEFGEDATVEKGGTSHISIADKEGMLVSMTSSIEGAFGSGQMVAGFLLNNQLTDFSFRPKDKNGVLIANRVQPMKRPRSSMSPTIVFDASERPKIIVGSPGGSRIITYVVKSLVAHLDWGMGPQDAVSLFNFGSRNGPFELEKRSETDHYVPKLEAFGQVVKKGVMTSGVQMIVLDYSTLGELSTLRGGADPRREGVVLGD